MKITKQKLKQIIKEEISNVINERHWESKLTDEEAAQFKAEIEKEWKWMQAVLTGPPEAKKGTEGLFNDWARGVVLPPHSVAGRYGEPISTTARVRSILMSWKKKDPDIAKAAGYIDQVLADLKEMRLETERTWTWASDNWHDEAARKKIHQMQKVDGSLISQRWGYAYTSLVWNDLMTPPGEGR